MLGCRAVQSPVACVRRTGGAPADLSEVVGQLLPSPLALNEERGAILHHDVCGDKLELHQRHVQRPLGPHPLAARLPPHPDDPHVSVVGFRATGSPLDLTRVRFRSED